MNRKDRRNIAKAIVKSQPLPKIRARYSSKLEEYKQMPLEDLQKLLETKMSRTDKLALQDAIDTLKKQEDETNINTDSN